MAGDVNWVELLEKHMIDYPVLSETSQAALSLEILRRLKRLEERVEKVVPPNA